MSGKSIAFDTEIVIILAGGNTDIENGLERARQLVEDCRDDRTDIYIPAPAFAECCHVDPKALSRMRVASFNAKAAMIANQVTAQVLRHGKGGSATRQGLKVDAMILSTAEALGVKTLYVGSDKWFQSAATTGKLKVEVRSLPGLRPKQENLPGVPGATKKGPSKG